MTENYQLWGGRFQVEPDVLMRQLNDSLRFDRILYGVDIQASMAYASALVDAGLLTHDEGAQLEQGLTSVLREFERDEFVPMVSDEDIHTAVERRLGELVGDVARKLHTGRSRNDQVATDIRLWLRYQGERLNQLLRDLQMALTERAESQTKTLMPGYTHLQPAQPITLAHWLMSYFWMLQRDRERLSDAMKRVNICPLGSGALSGTPYPIDREALATRLGFVGVTMNSLDAVSDRDSIAEILFIASLIGVHLSRFAEDVILYSNPQFGFIRLPDAYSTGSSLMPQKRNADPMELARGKAGRFIGNLTGLLTTLKGLPSTYNKDLQEDKEPLFDTLHHLSLLLTVMTGMTQHLIFLPEKMQAALDESLLATEIADWLVQVKGLPFREAHHLVGQIVSLCESRNLPFSQLPLADYQSVSSLFDEGVYTVLDFKTAVEKRQSMGGTSTAAVKSQIEQARRLLES